MAASPTTRRESTSPPPPVIGKAGRYTVFITPPSTPKPSRSSAEPTKVPPPVQPPPQQFEKPSSASRPSSASVFGFFWDAVTKVQEVHSSVDEYLADWFGLNQSKYQWALNDYYESKGIEKEAGKPKEPSGKGLGV